MLLALAFSASCLVVPMAGEAQSPPPWVLPNDFVLVLARTVSESGRKHEERGNFRAAASEYASASANASRQVNSYVSMPLADRLSLELLAASTALDTARMLVRLDDFQDGTVLQYLAAAEAWQEAALRDAQALQSRRSPAASSLAPLTYMTQGYLDVFKGRPVEASTYLGAAQQLEPARNLLTRVRGLNAAPVHGRFRDLAVRFQNARTLDPAVVKTLQAGVGVITLVAGNKYVSVIGAAVSAGLGVFAAPANR